MKRALKDRGEGFSLTRRGEKSPSFLEKEGISKNPSNNDFSPHQEAEEPDDADHGGDHVLRPELEVLDGARDGPVAVEGDQAQVQDRGRAEQHVQR